MTRKDFLQKIGIGAAFVLTTNCLSSCTKDKAAAVDFTLDLTDPSNLDLATNGNYVVRNGVVIARANDGKFVAATNTCSHQNQTEVVYDSAKNEYLCNAHGARFDLNGGGLNNNGSDGLDVYKTSVTGNILRVFS